ncbi:hypothetical protein [Natrinema sp. H-ect4]|uniref:hypothetical protein n=1 Tax=Natrinema sp. H-ect4 TaxID=3242699 RepID=UPI0035A928CA
MTRKLSHSIGYALITLTLILSSVIALSSIGLAADGYELSSPGAVNTPEETVSVDGSDYTISALATAKPDTSVTVDIEMGGDERFNLDILNDQEQAVTNTYRGSGTESTTINTSNVKPGTYAIVLQVDGGIVATLPLVIEKYDVSLDSTAIETTETKTTVPISVVSGANEQGPEHVEVAVWDGEEITRVPANHINGNEYEATFDDLETGEYQVYAAAQGTDTVLGQPEALGVSDGHHFNINTDNPNDGSEGSDGGDNPNDGSEGSDGGDNPNDGSEGSNGGDNSSDGSDELGDGQESNDLNETGDGNETNDQNKTDNHEDNNTSTDDGNESRSTGDNDSEMDDSVIEPTTEDDETPATDESADDEADSVPNRAIPLLAATILLASLIIRAANK